MEDALTFFYQTKNTLLLKPMFLKEDSVTFLLIYNILRTEYIKLPPKVINYRCYKKFNPEIFINKLLYYNLQYLPSDNLIVFQIALNRLLLLLLLLVIYLTLTINITKK